MVDSLWQFSRADVGGSGVGSEERSTTIQKRFMAHSFVRWCIAVLVPTLVLLGCSDSTVDSTVDSDRQLQPARQREANFQDQLRLGREGKSNQIHLEYQSVSDAMLSGLTEQDLWLKTLQLDAGAITDAGLESVAVLPALRHLRLRESPITDAGLERLASCSSIQILNLPQCDATATGVAALSALPSLWNLRLGGNQLNESTAEVLAKISTLRHVHLIGIPIDDDGLRQIVSLPNLESLYMDDSAVSQAGWEWAFENYPGLHLHVDQQHHDRDPGKH